MAGYLITLNDEKAVSRLVKDGVYSTIMKPPRYPSWETHHEGTFADYLSMKEGDKIFFFVDRKIYGCGKLINIGPDCKYLNYTDAGDPRGDQSDNYQMTHLLESGSSQNRCFCTFVPSPCFFSKGVDMDEVLQHNENPFRSVRTMWKLSFIKMDDDESEALSKILIKSNELNINNDSAKLEYDTCFHNKLKTQNLDDYIMDHHFLIKNCKAKKGNKVNHEMALEASLCEILLFEDRQPFGQWDYISHQVAASPLKPIDYMDKMDIFGYRYIPGFGVKSKYIIAELKKDKATRDTVEQIMKYVDWVSNEYANKDYSMIEAYIIASDFDDEIIPMIYENCVRNYTKGFRPPDFCRWDELKLVRYEVSEDDIVLDVIDLDGDLN